MYEEFKVIKPLQILSFYSVFEQVFDNGHYFPGEAHDFWELVCVIDGNATMSAGERVYNLRANDIILHKPMEVHKFKINTAKTRLFIISFSAAGVFLKKLENCVVHLSEKQINKLNTLRMLVGGREVLNQYDIETHFLKSIRENPEKMQILVCECEVFLLSLFENREIEKGGENTAHIYRKAVGFMEENIYENIGMEAVADECHVSVAYLKKIFSRYAGVGVHKYYLNLKLKYAAQLLLKGESVGNVAQKLSFSSQNYFSIVFKREMGISPMLYKKMKTE